MSRPRFLADHDLNEHIVDGVLRRDPRVVFVRARDAGLAGRRAPEVLEYAFANGLIVVSHDVNTMSMHACDRVAARLPLSGLLLVRQSDPILSAIESLLLIWSASEAEEWVGSVVFLPL